MKSRVELSSYCFIISSIGIAVMCGAFLFGLKRHAADWTVWLLAAMILTLCLSALIYMPLSVSVDDKALTVSRPLWHKSIPLAKIASVRLFQPTMGERRIIGSGGWFGYYGRFSDREIGKYFAYYGKASDCFLVTLNDGRQYVLGCKNPGAMVEAISSRLHKDR